MLYSRAPAATAGTGSVSFSKKLISCSFVTCHAAKRSGGVFSYISSSSARTLFVRDWQARVVHHRVQQHPKSTRLEQSEEKQTTYCYADMCAGNNKGGSTAGWA